MRKGTGDEACFQPGSGHSITGAGGPGWCVNCHAPADNLEPSMPPWSRFRASSRGPVRELISPLAREGITCVACHQLRHADAGATRAGNPSWRSFLTGIDYPSRPEDGFGLFGIANSAYQFDVSMFAVPGAAPHSVQRAARAHAWRHTTIARCMEPGPPSELRYERYSCKPGWSFIELKHVSCGAARSKSPNFCLGPRVSPATRTVNGKFVPHGGP